MAVPERASVFGEIEDDLPDLSTFQPTPKATRPKPEKAAIREVAARAGFTSREPSTTVPAQLEAAPHRAQRRHTTGRNRQLNLKVTENALTRFYALAEREGWVLGQAFEEAVAALEVKLAG